MKKRIILLTTVSLLYTNMANAAYERHTVPQQCIATAISDITGTTGHRTLVELQSAMASDAAMFVQNYTMNTQAFIGNLGQATSDLEFSMGKTSEMMLKRQRDDEKAFLQQEQDFQLELLNQDFRNKQSPINGLVREEAVLILDFLEKFGIEGGITPLEVYALLSEQSGEAGVSINVATLAGEKSCTEEELEDGYCSYKKIVKPQETFKIFFQKCNEEKKAMVLVSRQDTARKAAIQEESIKTSTAINSRNASAAIGKRIKDSKKVDCSPADYLNGICYDDLSKEDFQEKVVKSIIIPNSSVSPTNFLAPTEIGGLNLMELEPEDIAVLKEEAYDYTVLEENPMQNQNLVPIVLSYKNSNQLKAAIAYADNIIASDLVDNQEPRLRASPNSAEFQSRFNNRLASLNLARSAFYESIKIRSGEKLGKAWEEGAIDSIDSLEPMKESILGAGELDILLNKVDQAYKDVAMTDGGEINTNPMAQNENQDEKHWIIKNYQMIGLQNEILFRQLLQNEKSELLKAAQLQNIINSPENIEYLRRLRNN